MSTNSSAIGAAPVPQTSSGNLSTKKYKPPMAVKLFPKIETLNEKPASKNSIDINVSSEIRSLLSHGICSTRLEILALLDFHPLFQHGSKTLAGDLLEIRHTKRKIDLDNAVSLINKLKSQNPDAYQNVYDIYTANIQSANVELALLNSAYTMKEYGSRAFSYISHLENFLIPELGGEKAKSLYEQRLKFDPNNQVQSQEGSTLFAQLLADASAFSRFGYPKILSSKGRKFISGEVNNDIGVSSTPNSSAAYYSVRVARELAASLKISEIKNSLGEEKESHSTFKSVVGEDFFTANGVPESTVFEKIYGIDQWSDESSNLDVSFDRKNSSKIIDLANSTALVGKIDVPEKSILLLEDGIRSYSSKTFLPSTALVNTAFKSPSTLDFKQYNDAAIGFYSSCKDSAEIHRQLYFPKFKGKTSANSSFSAGDRISPSSLFQEVIRVFKFRCASTLANSLYSNSLTSNEEVVSYVLNMAHVFMRDDPSSAAKILKAFAADYKMGILTRNSNKLTISSSLESAKSYLRNWIFSREEITGVANNQEFDPETNITSEKDLRNSVLIYASVNSSALLVLEDLILYEVIDYGLSVIRGLITRFSNVEELSQDQKTWPTLLAEETVPYNTFYKPYIDTAYASNSSRFNAEFWVPTLLAASAKFERGNLGKTWFSGMDLEQVYTGIYKIHSSFMNANFRMLKVKKRRVSQNKSSNAPSIIYAYLGIEKSSASSSNSKSSSGSDNFRTYFLESADLIKEFLQSNPESYKNVAVSSKDRNTMTLLSSIKNTIESLKDDDASLRSTISTIYMMGQRVKSFSENMVDTFTGGDGGENAVYNLVQQLSKRGSAGLDIVENLNSEQLSLKKFSASRQSGNPNRGYVPNGTIVSEDEKMAIATLASSKNLQAPEGLNTRCISVGIPAGALKNLELTDKFSVAVRMSDIELCDIVFKPKFYNFDSSLFLGTEAFKYVKDFSSFDAMIRQVVYTYSKLIVREVPGSSPRLTQTSVMTPAKFDPENYDVFSNTAVSSLMELYYKLLTGIELNEDTFLSVQTNLGIPLNKYAGNVSAALASLSADLAPNGSSRAEYYKNAANLTTESNLKRSVKIADFNQIDAEFLSSVKNAYTTRLLSAEDMRDTILKSRVFDRVINLLIDPDDFEVATTYNNPGKSSTSQVTLDKYLSLGLITASEENGQTKYKLHPRKSSDGRMAFVKLMCSIEPYSSAGSLAVAK